MAEQTGQPDEDYGLISVLYHALQGAETYSQYIKDAEAANSPECAAYFRKVHETAKAQLAEAKRHLVGVLQGKMGSAPKQA